VLAGCSSGPRKARAPKSEAEGELYAEVNSSVRANVARAMVRRESPFQVTLSVDSMDPGELVTGLESVYRIETRHGQGSFGVTYRARDEAGGGPVIVKELRIEKLDDWKALELFEREGQVLASLSHPNIPGFRDFFAHGGPVPLAVGAMSTYRGPDHLSLVLVQEFIPGATLQQRVDQGQRLAPAEAVTILRALLGALCHLHERSPPLVHRDIKPGNIILTPEGRPYLVDFGAIQNQLRSLDSVGSTIVGTVGYMPLEQIRGDARPASDLYALGVTLVVSIAGRALQDLPFDDATGKIALRHALPNDTPKALLEALDSMVAPLLGQRAQSAREVMARFNEMHARAASTPAEEQIAPQPAKERTAPKHAHARTAPKQAYQPLYSPTDSGPDSDDLERSKRPQRTGPGMLARMVDNFGGMIGFGCFLLGIVGVPLLFLVLFVTRQSLLDGSKDQFSKRYVCPLDRVQSTPRPDINVVGFEYPKQSPPRDIAADPARVAVWQANQPKPRDTGDEIFEVQGCGQHLLWACHRGKSSISCSYERDLAQSASKPDKIPPPPPATNPKSSVAGASSNAVPFASGQTWSGTYVCAQGSTSLLLHIIGVDHAHVEARFEFDYQPKNIHGEFRSRGDYDPAKRGIDLVPSGWLDQPRGYVMVGMRGLVLADGRTFSGTIEGPSCTTFSVHLTDP
jgi:serine/threonine protein kinase